MDSVSQSFQPRKGATLPIYSQQVERAAAGLFDTIEPLRQAAKFEAENIGHSVNQMIQYFESLVQNTVGAASNVKNSKQQEQLLDQAKSVTESALQLIYSAKDCGEILRYVLLTYKEVCQFVTCLGNQHPSRY